MRHNPYGFFGLPLHFPFLSVIVRLGKNISTIIPLYFCFRLLSDLMFKRVFNLLDQIFIFSDENQKIYIYYLFLPRKLEE